MIDLEAAFAALTDRALFMVAGGVENARETSPPFYSWLGDLVELERLRRTEGQDFEIEYPVLEEDELATVTGATIFVSAQAFEAAGECEGVEQDDWMAISALELAIVAMLDDLGTMSEPAS